MESSENPYAAPDDSLAKRVTVDWLLVDGTVNVGKDKGLGLLLFTPSSVFAFRQNMQAATVGGATGGLVGGLIGHAIDKYSAKKQPASRHMDDPEINAIGDLLKKKINRAVLLIKVPLNQSLRIERTWLGFRFGDAQGEQILYRGLIHKNKIAQFLTVLGIAAH